MLGRDYTDQNCSVARSLEIVGERWTLLIVRDAFLGVRRFDGFARKLGLASNILSRRLATLVDAGVLERRTYQERPPRDEYTLTERGLTLFPVIVALMAWGDDHFAPSGPPVSLRHRDCGGDLDAGARCARCSTPVGAREAEWWWGPGSNRPPAPLPVPALTTTPLVN